MTRNINRLKSEFVNPVDTVGGDNSVKKTILLASPAESRTVSPPTLISLEDYKNPPPAESFTGSYIPVAALLEGHFNSLYANRMVSWEGGELKKKSKTTKMIVVADGDIIRNEVRRIGNRLEPERLGLDRYSGQTFGNKDFVINCLNYLIDDRGLIDLRSRELKVRLLNKEKISDNRLLWQLINTLGPIFLVLLAGSIYILLRKRKYAA